MAKWIVPTVIALYLALAKGTSGYIIREYGEKVSISKRIFGPILALKKLGTQSSTDLPVFTVLFSLILGVISGAIGLVFSLIFSVKNPIYAVIVCFSMPPLLASAFLLAIYAWGYSNLIRGKEVW